MACIEKIVCLGNFCSCGNISITDLISPITGQIRMEVEFNGSTIVKNISAVNGSSIVIPNVFNENYTHILSFYINGILWNDEKYSIRVTPCLNADNSDPMVPIYSSIILESLAGNTIVDNRIEGEIVTGLMISDVSKNKGYTVSGNTITFTDSTTLEAGLTITVFFQ